jgi:hypothetical protein
MRSLVERVTIRETQRGKRGRGRARRLTMAELVVHETIARPNRLDLLPTLTSWPRDPRGGYAASPPAT